MTYNKEWISKKEIDLLFENTEISSRDLLLMKVCYSGAFRMGEILKSKWEDYRFEDGYCFMILRDQKTDKKNWEKQVIDKSVYGDVKRFCKDNNIRSQDYIFQSNRKKKLSFSRAFEIVKECAKKTGIDKQITTHSFRRSRASHLLDDGLDLYIVSKILRHKSIDTTQKYLKLSKKSLYDKISAIDKNTIFNVL